MAGVGPEGQIGGWDRIKNGTHFGFGLNGAAAVPPSSVTRRRTRRFAVGHNPGEDGKPSVARLWRGSRPVRRAPHRAGTELRGGRPVQCRSRRRPVQPSRRPWALQTYLGVTDRDPEPIPYDPAAIGLLSGSADEYIVTDGGLKGQRGFFTRDASGTVVGIDLAGRLFQRVSSAFEVTSVSDHWLRRGCRTVRDLVAATVWRPSVVPPSPPTPRGRGAYRE